MMECRPMGYLRFIRRDGSGLFRTWSRWFRCAIPTPFCCQVSTTLSQHHDFTVTRGMLGGGSSHHCQEVTLRSAHKTTAPRFRLFPALVLLTALLAAVPTLGSPLHYQNASSVSTPGIGFNVSNSSGCVQAYGLVRFPTTLETKVGGQLAGRCNNNTNSVTVMVLDYEDVVVDNVNQTNDNLQNTHFSFTLYSPTLIASVYVCAQGSNANNTLCERVLLPGA